MKLSLHRWKDKNVVIWRTELEEKTIDRIQEVYVEFSVLKDSGELGDIKSREIPAWEFTDHFELQPEKVEIGWSRIVPRSEG